MDRRSYGIGIGVGQFMANQDLDKSDIQEYFVNQYDEGGCDECPFMEECEKVTELSSKKYSLCDIICGEEDKT